MQKERVKYPKGSVENQLVKLILNSLYGSTAAGINCKSTFNSKSMESDYGRVYSRISNPLIASYTTSFIRGVLAEQVYRLEKEGIYKILSCTTDGWVTNSPDISYPTQIKAGVISRYYSRTRFMLSGDRSVYELKNQSKGIINITVRGQFGLDKNGLLAIKAMTGFQRRYWDPMAIKTALIDVISNDSDYNKELIYTFVQSRGIPEIYRTSSEEGAVMTTQFRQRRYRVKFDNRRNVDPATKVTSGPSNEFALHYTIPFKHKDTCVRARALANMGEPKYKENSLYIPSGDKGIKYSELLIRSFTRAILQGKIGCEIYTTRERGSIP